jgi:hypothetical protein
VKRVRLSRRMRKWTRSLLLGSLRSGNLQFFPPVLSIEVIPVMRRRGRLLSRLSMTLKLSLNGKGRFRPR